MKSKRQLLSYGFMVLIVLFLMSSCNKQNETITQSSPEMSQNKIEAYIPDQKVMKTSYSKDQITDYAWEVYQALSEIRPEDQNNEAIYEGIEKTYFVELDETHKKGYFPWFEDTLFSVMHFKHIKALREAVVCTKTVVDRTYYLVQLTVMGSYHYELTSNDVVEQKSGLTTMVLYMLLATKKDGSLGYYSLLSFTKEPHELEVEIKMFNGIVDAQDEQYYLKTVETTPPVGLKAITDDEQYAQNNSRVVTVFAEQKEGTILQANGCYVHQYLILVPLEIIENCSNAWIYTSEHELIQVVGVVNTDKEQDLALIKLEHDLPYDVSPFERGEMDIMKISDLVYIIGNQKGIGNSLSEGVVTQFWTYQEVEYCQTTVPIETAYLGSALLDTYGRLVGIVSNRIPHVDSFIQSTQQMTVFDAYFTSEGKDATVQIPFSPGIGEKSVTELIKLVNYYFVYSNENLPSDLKVNSGTMIYDAVVQSLKNRNDYLSGAYTLSGEVEKENENLYFSAEIDLSELEDQRTLRETFLVENEGKPELYHFVAYDEVEILAVSEETSTPYVLVEVKMSFYDKEQSPESPIITIRSMELLKYDSTTTNYQFVGTVY